MFRFASLLLFAPLLATRPVQVAGGGKAGAASPEDSHNLLSVHLEREHNGQIEAMRPDHVFDTGDIIRFRVTAGQDGYLYVLDQGSSGAYTVLFPGQGSTTSNQIQRRAEYTVPANGDGWFAVDPPAGFDTIYFLLSPAPLATVPQGSSPDHTGPAPQAPLNPNLKPRCDDSIFRARGECIDRSAGPAPLTRGVVLPPQITLAAPHASRDIVLATDDDGTSVSASASGTQPVVYTFRLAHR